MVYPVRIARRLISMKPPPFLLVFSNYPRDVLMMINLHTNIFEININLLQGNFTCDKSVRIRIKALATLLFDWWGTMAKPKIDYSEYRRHVISLASVMTFLAGFIFTVITLLLSQLPDLSSVVFSVSFLWQFTLFF